MVAAMRTKTFQTDPNRTQIVEIVGRMDNAHAAALTGHAEDALAHGRPHLILDMSAGTFIIRPPLLMKLTAHTSGDS